MLASQPILLERPATAPLVRQVSSVPDLALRGAGRPAQGAAGERMRPSSSGLHIAGAVPTKKIGHRNRSTNASSTKQIVSLYSPDSSYHDEPPSAAHFMLPKSAAQEARQTGTNAWLARDYERSAAAFGELAALYAGENASAHAEALRLRGAALVKLKRFEEAGAGALAALTSLGQPDADPKTDKEFQELAALAAMGTMFVDKEAVPAWQLLGASHAARGDHRAAAHSLGRGLLLLSVELALLATPSVEHPPRVLSKGQPQPSTAFGALLTQFLDACEHAAAATLPLQVYTAADAAAPAQGAVSASLRRAALRPPLAVPAFRLVLRPKFAPWPLELQLTELPAVEEQDGVRLAFFCAFKEMPNEPHCCLYANRTDKHALVLVSIRLDGLMEIVSNSTAAAWEQVDALLGQPPQPRSLEDFEVVSSGWETAGAAVAAYASLVRSKWQEWTAGRGRAAAARKLEERALRDRQAALLAWLTELGLQELHPLLIREGIDLSTMQYVTEADLQAMGVTQLAQRRKLLAAVETQQQYVQLTERIAALEAEAQRHHHAHGAQEDTLQAAHAALDAARAQSAGLAAALEAETARRCAAEETAAATTAELGTARDELAKLEAKAAAFAEDIEALLAQLHGTNDAQRGALKDLRKSIDVELVDLTDRVRRGAYLKGEARRRSSMAVKELSGLSERLASNKPAPVHAHFGASGASTASQPACR